MALEHRDGAWSLELEQLVRINRNTFRPRRERVRGVQAILQHLHVHDGALVDSTRGVLESLGDGEGRFELGTGGSWVAAPAREPIAGSAPGERPVVDAGGMKALIGEIKALRGRVEALEAEVQALRESPAQPAAAPASNPSEDAEASQEGAAVPEAEAEPQSAGPAGPEYEPLSMPAIEAIADLVKGLVGDEVHVTGTDSQWSLSEPQKSYLAPLNDDAGETIGALVMDLEATIRLAGGMLMEPADELDVQVAEEAPSEDVLDAAGEVLNTLTSAVNKVKGNAHVRAAPLEAFDIEAHKWLVDARGRQDFSCSIGGLFTVIAR